MKRSLLICAAIMMLLQGMAQNVNADTLQLTLDLNNTVGSNAASGGVWRLYARRVDGAGGVVGDNGVAGIRAIINNIDATGITFAADINANGAANFQNIGGTTVEVVYGQNIGATGVITGLGIAANVNLDKLIATGTWPAGAARPTFGTDGALSSEGNFLSSAVAPFAAIEASGANVTTQVVTLGDFNNTGTVSASDTAPYRRQLLGTDPYNPAGDFNNSGSVSASDTGSYRAELLETGPLVAAVAVPEPSTVGLALIAGMGLIARRRRV